MLNTVTTKQKVINIALAANGKRSIYQVRGRSGAKVGGQYQDYP
jgi:hypothetical protein